MKLLMRLKRQTLAVIVLLALAATGRADVITWGFVGHTAGEGLPGGACSPVICSDILHDEPFFGLIRFDLGALDLNADPLSGRYESIGSPFGISIKIGDFFYQTDDVLVGVRAEPLTTTPQYNFFSNHVGPTFRRIGLVNCYPAFSGIILTDAQLATPPPAPGGVGGCPDPAFITTLEGFDIALNVTGYFAISEPWPLSLWGAGFAAMMFARRGLSA